MQKPQAESFFNVRLLGKMRLKNTYTGGATEWSRTVKANQPALLATENVDEVVCQRKIRIKVEIMRFVQMAH